MKIANYKHYAKALVSLGQEQGNFEEVIADLVDVEEKMANNLEFKHFLNDQHISLAKKKQVLQNVFQDFISSITYNFLYLLITNKKLNLLVKILDEAKKQYKIGENIVEAQIETVVPLTSSQEQHLTDALAQKFNKKIIINNIINEDILGGIRLTIEDTIIDTSIFGKLENLKKKISQITNHK